MARPKKFNKAHKPHVKHNLVLRDVYPKTVTQRHAFECYRAAEVGFSAFIGCAGTGKTFIALYLALSEIQRGTKRHVCFVRSTVPARDQGFLPGTEEEKAEPYRRIFVSMVNDLYDCGTAYAQLSQTGVIRFASTSFEQGATFDDTVVIVDECQNLSYEELDLFATRLGDNSRLVLCGDTAQNYVDDYDKRGSGLFDFLDVIDRMDSANIIDFTPQDIVRSGLVKEYILARERALDVFEAEEIAEHFTVQ